MHNRDSRLHALVKQIWEEPGQLHGGKHALVGDCARRQGSEVNADFMLDAFADAEGLAIEIDSRKLAFRIGHDQGLE